MWGRTGCGLLDILCETLALVGRCKATEITGEGDPWSKKGGTEREGPSVHLIPLCKEILKITRKTLQIILHAVDAPS